MGDLAEEPPEGFESEYWATLCKIDCKDTDLLSISRHLVGQTLSEVAKALCVQFEDTESTQDQTNNPHHAHHRLLITWQTEKNLPRKSSLGDLVHSLSKLNDKDLLEKVIADVNERATAVSCGEFQAYPPPSDSDSLARHDSDSSGGSRSLTSFSGLNSFPVECTDCTQPFPFAVEQAEIDIFSVLVTGKLPYYSLNDVAGNLDVTSSSSNFVAKRVRGLQREFASLLRQAFAALSREPSSVDQLRVFVNQLCADQNGSIPLYSESMLALVSIEQVQDIFLLLSRIGAWDFLNFSILVDVLDEFRVTHLEEQMSKYKDKIACFKDETALVDFLSVWGGKSDDQILPDCKAVIARSGADIASFTLANASEMAGFLADEFNLKLLNFRLANGCPGSVYVMWLVPSSAALHMLERMKSRKVPDLLQCGILELGIDRTIFKVASSYESQYKLSVTKPGLFWGNVGKATLLWKKRSKKVYSFQKNTGTFQWFPGAQLNVSENCLDRHVSQFPNKVAVIWEKDDESTEEISYSDLLKMTCQVANVLRSKGIQKGDVVVIYLPTMPLAVASMLACARIGAVHCVVFSAFGQSVLKERVLEVGAKAIITANKRVVGGEVGPLKERVDNALKGNTEVKLVLVAKRTEDIVNMTKDRDFFLEKEMKEVPSECDPEYMDGEDLLLIAYTSGTESANSKAVYHTQAGYLLYTTTTHKFLFNIAPDDVIGCVSDLGWMAAHSYVVYGPLCNGNTTVLFESTATYPDPGRYWKMVDKLKVTHFYTVPSVLKRLRKEDETFISQYDLKSLKVISVGGEPIPPDIQNWYYTKIGKGKCLFLDTWGQTELGGTGIIRWLAPEGKKPSHFPSSGSFAFFGVDPLLVSRFEQCAADESKAVSSKLYLKLPLPGMGRQVLHEGKKKSFAESYFSKEHGCYNTYDLAERNEKNEIQVVGRSDNAVFIQGVWLDIPAIETVLRTTHTGTKVWDALVVSKQCPVDKEPGLCAFLHTTTHMEDNEKKQTVFYTISSIASKFGKNVVRKFHIFFLDLSNLPSTVSGKTSHWPFRNYVEESLSRSDCPAGSYTDVTYQDVFKTVV